MKKLKVLKKWLDDRDLEPKHLADLTGLSLPLIYKHISGQREVGAKAARAYHKITKIPYKVLLED